MEEAEDAGEGLGAAGVSMRRRRGRASEGFKEKVLGVLTAHGLAEKRGAKMSQDEFLAMLAAFNQAGIHFA
jgi:18S rRNA (adenine1779-N6/adenine1780-N6)-dimethyltransferase